MIYVIVDEGEVKTTNVDHEIFTRSIEAPDDIMAGDKYEDGKWVRCGQRPCPPTSAEQREHEYKTNPLIDWQGQKITVDQANTAYLQYFAEASPKAQEIQVLIIGAKEYIRGSYPDMEG